MPWSQELPVELSVVIPCLNESKTLGTCIHEAKVALLENRISGELIIADNGSTDGSQAIAEQCGATVVHVSVKGYGSALQAGIKAARGRYVITGDADEQHDFKHIPRFIEKLREGFDLVVGNRFSGGILPGAMPPLHRYFGSPILNAIGRTLFDSPIRDFHCGLRAFSKVSYEQLNVRTTGMEFGTEMIVRATLLRLKIAQVPTTMSPDGRNRPAHLRTWRDGWRHLRFLLLYSPRWLFFYPGAALFGTGLAGLIWLAVSPRTLNVPTLDLHIMLYATAAVEVGFQAMALGLFAKIFAVTQGLLPQDKRLNVALRYLTLEAGLIAGLALVLAGLLTSAFAVIVGGRSQFSTIDSARMLRLVIPAVTALCLGAQVITYSFFLSMLGLANRDPVG